MSEANNDCCTNPYNITTDCRSDEGVTVGLVDSLIFICRVLAKRDLDGWNTGWALSDLVSDEDFNKILNKGKSVTKEAHK